MGPERQRRTGGRSSGGRLALAVRGTSVLTGRRALGTIPCAGARLSYERSVFVFPVADRHAVEAVLDSSGERQSSQWVIDGLLFARIDEPPNWSDGWTNERIAAVREALGSEPPLVVAVDVSGRATGWEEVRRLTTALLEIGPGVVVDDWSDHPWRVSELDEGQDHDGMRFFGRHRA